MKKLLLAALLLLPVPAVACSPAQPFFAKVSELPGWSVAALNEKQTAAAIELIKADNPGVDPELDKAYLVQRPDGSGALILGKGDDIFGLAVFDPEHYRAMKRTLMGEDA